MRIWIGFTGYARTGKSSLVRLLQARIPDLKELTLGQIIKESADPVLKAYLGISAFTEDDREKAIIRPFLVQHGYHWYKPLLDRYQALALREPRLVNSRIFRLQEAFWWKSQGGLLFEVVRPGVGPAEPKEEEELELVRSAGLIDATLHNEGSLEDLNRLADEVMQHARTLLGHEVFPALS